MRSFVFMLVCGVAFADANVCDISLADRPEQLNMIRFLRKYVGQYKLGECQVEFHVCDPDKLESNRGSLVGDMLVVSKKGEENYVPIHFVAQNSDKFQVKIQTSNVMFNYFLKDKIKDPQSGRLEEYRLEILKNWDDDGLNQITLGTYNSKRDFWHIGTWTYRWSECFSKPPQTL